MRIHVDPDRCQGHTLCAMRAPALFELDETDGHSTAGASGEVPAGQEGPARAAALGCPERAIEVS